MMWREPSLFSKRRRLTGDYRENRATLFLEVHGRQWTQGTGKSYLGIRNIIPSEMSDKRVRKACGRVTSLG